MIRKLIAIAAIIAILCVTLVVTVSCDNGEEQEVKQPPEYWVSRQVSAYIQRAEEEVMCIKTVRSDYVFTEEVETSDDKYGRAFTYDVEAIDYHYNYYKFTAIITYTVTSKQADVRKYGKELIAASQIDDLDMLLIIYTADCEAIW